jgi:hypothetical protein
MNGYPADRYPAGRYPEDGYPPDGYPEGGYPANDDPYPRGPGGIRDADSVWRAWRILNLADGQAASIAQQAWARVNAIHETAERHTAVVRQQARNQIAAIRQAAEREAAGLLGGPEWAGPAAEYGAEGVSLPEAAALPAGQAPGLRRQLPGTQPSP